MELTFFTAAHTVQFGFVAKRMLTTHRCFGCGWTALAQYQGFIYFPYSVPRVSVLRVGEKLWGNMAGTADPNSSKRYSVTCNVGLGNKNWGRGKSILFDGFGFFGGIFFLAPKAVIWRKAGHQSACGRWWEISFVLHFSFHWWNCLYLDPQVFSTSFFPILLMGTRSEQSAVWVLAGVDSPQKYTEQMVFSEVSKWAVVFSLLCLQSTGAEVTQSPLVREFGFWSCFAKFRWSDSYGYW